MKKFNQYLLHVAFIALSAVAFFSCNKKVDNPAPINLVDTTKTATITGIAYAELNTSNSEREKVPAGTKIKVVVDSKQYASTVLNGYTYQLLTYTTTVGSDGTYSVKVPALNKEVTVSIVGDQFVANRQTNVNNTNPVRTVYSVDSPSIGIRADLTYNLDLQYEY